MIYLGPISTLTVRLHCLGLKLEPVGFRGTNLFAPCMFLGPLSWASLL